MDQKRVEKLVLTAAGVLIVSAMLKKGVSTVTKIASRSDFKRAMIPIAASVQSTFGIQPIITITQSALESNWGRSELTVRANNLFGFTGDSWKAAGKPVIMLPTTEYVKDSTGKLKKVTVDRPFRSYSSWQESANDWARLIFGTARYAKAYTFAKNGDVDLFAVEIQKAGYATDPAYSNSIIQVASVVKTLDPIA